MEEGTDVCGGGKGSLASELAHVLAMVKELEASMDQDLPAAARELCGALASSVDRSLRIARSCWPPPDSPPSGDGAHGPAAGGNAGRDAQFKRRKGMPRVRRQVRVASVQDAAALDDGLSWRKYGQKDILGAKYPRAYFRCTHRQTQGCLATKQVQRADGDPLLIDVVYHGAHTCAQAAHPSAAELRLQLEHDLAGHGQEQSSMLAPETGGVQAGLEPVTPFSFAAAPIVPGNDSAAASGFFPLLSPTSMEWQLRSSLTAAGFGVDMELESQFDELFTNPTEPSQWEFQDLYAAN
ncbi:hypothetical protein ACP4OV_021279 [Aristida adscensionis]